jgi:hypothetical protein
MYLESARKYDNNKEIENQDALNSMQSVWILEPERLGNHAGDIYVT